MSFVRKAFPHASILIANMYYVFFGIDRVNKAMNFIDNGITKTLLMLLCLMTGTMTYDLFFGRGKRKFAGKNSKTALYAAASILGAVYLVLYLIDLFKGGESGLILNEMVKFMILLFCLCTSFSSVLEVAQQRMAARRIPVQAVRQQYGRAAGVQGSRDYQPRHVQTDGRQARLRSYSPDEASSGARRRSPDAYAARTAYRTEQEYSRSVSPQRRTQDAQQRYARRSDTDIRTRSRNDIRSNRMSTEREYRVGAGSSGSSRAYRTEYDRSARYGSSGARTQRSTVSQGYSQRSVRSERQEHTQYTRQGNRTR